MADTDPARIGDVKAGLAAAKADTATRAKKTELSSAVEPLATRDGSNVEADAFRGAIGAGDMLAANNLSDLTSPSAARTVLGLGDAATKSVGTTAGTVAAGDDSRILAVAGRAMTDGSNVEADAFRGAIGSFPTRAAAIASRIGESNVDAIRLDGYAAPGDGGAALYKRVVSEPTHPGKLQSADGQWWELGEPNINVHMFGAVGDGTTADQAAINSALSWAAANNCGVVRLQDRNYRVTGTITMQPGVSLVGMGVDGTWVTTATDAITMINFPASSPAASVESLRIINYVGTPTSGALIKIDANEGRVFNIVGSGGWNGLVFSEDNRACRAMNVDFSNWRNDAVLIDGGGNQYLTNVTTYNNFGVNTNDSFHIKATIGYWLISCVSSLARHGLHVEPDAGKEVYNGFITNCDFDASWSEGVKAGGAGRIGLHMFTGCRASFSSSDGVLLNNPTTEDWSFVNSEFAKNRLNGARVSAGRRVCFGTGTKVVGNASTGQSADGILIENCESIQVTGIATGAFSNDGNNQRYGVRIAATYTGAAPIVQSNDLRGNTQGGYINASAVANTNVSGNTGYVNEAYLTITIPPGQTTATTPHGLSTTPKFLADSCEFANFRYSTSFAGSNILGTISDAQGGPVKIMVYVRG